MIALFILLICFGVLGFIWIAGKTLFFNKNKNSRGTADLFLSPKHLLGEIFLLSGSFLSLSFIALLNYRVGQIVEMDSILLFAGVIFVVLAFYFKSFIVSIWSIALIFVWMIFKMDEWSVDYADIYSGIKSISFIGFSGLFFVGIYLLGSVIENISRMQRWAFWYRFFGTVGVIVSFYLVYALGEGNPFSLFHGDYLYNENRILALYSLVTLGVSFLSAWVYYKKTIPTQEVISIWCIIACFVIISFFPAIGNENLIFDDRGLPILTGVELFWILFFYTLIFGVCLWSIFIGVLKKQAWMINIAILFILGFTLDLYFSWFIKFLDKSLFFIVTGLCFLLIGFLMERARRYLLGRIRSNI